MAVKIVVSGLSAAAEALERVSEINKAEFLNELGGLVESQTRDRFNQGAAPDGTVWAPKSDGSPSFLQRGGGLLDSIHHVVTGNEVEVGSNKIYAGVHQDGARIKPKSANVLAFRVGSDFVVAKSVNIPARPYIGFSRENEAAIERQLEDFVVRKMGGK